jgi:hypothetical protein
MADFVKAARTTEIEPGQARLVEVNAKQIALFNIDGQLARLPHMFRLAGGAVIAKAARAKMYLQQGQPIEVPFRGGVVLIHPRDPCIQQYLGK